MKTKTNRKILKRKQTKKLNHKGGFFDYFKKTKINHNPRNSYTIENQSKRLIYLEDISKELIAFIESFENKINKLMELSIILEGNENKTKYVLRNYNKSSNNEVIEYSILLNLEKDINDKIKQYSRLKEEFDKVIMYLKVKNKSKFGVIKYKTEEQIQAFRKIEPAIKDLYEIINNRYTQKRTILQNNTPRQVQLNNIHTTHPNLSLNNQASHYNNKRRLVEKTAAARLALQNELSGHNYNNV